MDMYTALKDDPKITSYAKDYAYPILKGGNYVVGDKKAIGATFYVNGMSQSYESFTSFFHTITTCQYLCS